MARSIAYGRLSAVLFLAATGMLRCTAATMPIAATQAVPKPLGLLWPSQSFDLHDQQEVAALALSPDGSRIAIASASVVLLLDRHTGREIWRSQAVSRSVASVHFSSDGERLIAANGWNSPKGRGILIFEAGTGREISSISGNRHGTRDAVLSPDGKTILSVGGSGYSVEGEYSALWDARTGELLHQSTDDPAGHERSTRAACFLPDGKRYLSLGYGWVHLHETVNGKLVSQLDNVQASAATISPDGARAVLCTGDGLVIWDIQRNDARRIITGQQVRGAAFVNEDLFITWGVELRMWNAVSGDEVSWSGTYQSDVVFGAAAGTLIVGSNGRRVQVFGLRGTGAPPGVDPLGGQPRDLSVRPTPPLIAAAGRGDLKRVRALISRGVDVNAMQGPTDRSGTTALHMARDYDVALALLDAGADVNARSSSDWNRTPLHFAVERFTGPNSLRVIDLLLERGARIEATYGYDQTVLQLAAKAGNRELARHLIAKGAQYDLWSAAALGDADRVLALVKATPDSARQRGPTTRRNALYWASTREVIDVLLQAGAPADITDAWGATPEQDLRANGHIDLADYLSGKTRKADGPHA